MSRAGSSAGSRSRPAPTPTRSGPASSPRTRSASTSPSASTGGPVPSRPSSTRSAASATIGEEVIEKSVIPRIVRPAGAGDRFAVICHLSVVRGPLFADAGLGAGRRILRRSESLRRTRALSLLWSWNFGPRCRLSKLAENLTAETAFTVLALARALKAQGKDVVELEIGDSPFPSTPHAKAAGIRAIEENQTGYCPSLGLPEFREAAARFVASEFGIRGGGRERRGRLGGETVRAVLRRGAARPRRRRPDLQPAFPHLCPQPPAPWGAGGDGAASGRERVPAAGGATSRSSWPTTRSRGGSS